MANKKRQKKEQRKTCGTSIVLRNQPRPVEMPLVQPGDARAELNRWFDDMQSAMENRFFNPWVPASAWINVKEPTMDIMDKGGEFVIHADMPGVPRENIEIDVTPTQIEISGEYGKNTDDSAKDYIRQERKYSQFYRTSELPAEVVAERAEARISNGVLEIHLPKKQPTPGKKRHRVAVQ
jgi:HSP20 family protein